MMGSIRTVCVLFLIENGDIEKMLFTIFQLFAACKSSHAL